MDLTRGRGRTFTGLGIKAAQCFGVTEERLVQAGKDRVLSRMVRKNWEKGQPLEESKKLVAILEVMPLPDGCEAVGQGTEC